MNLPWSVKAHMSLSSCLYCPRGIFMITSVPSSQESWEIWLELHPFPDINSLLQHFWKELSRWLDFIGMRCGEPLVTPNFDFFSPLPIRYLNPSLRTSLAANKLFQIRKWCPLGLASIISQLLQYFSLKIMVAIDWGCSSKRQSCLASRALLSIPSL